MGHVKQMRFSKTITEHKICGEFQLVFHPFNPEDEGSMLL
jgi:hypothetical protein